MVLVSGIYRPEIGGPATYIPLLAENLMALKHNVEIVTLKDSSAAKQNEPWPVNYINRDQFLFIRFLKTVLLVLTKIRGVDVIFANGLFQETAIAASLLRKRSVAKVVSDPVWERALNKKETSLGVVEFNSSSINFKHKLQRVFLRWSLNRFNVITCPSIQLKHMIENWGVYKPIEFIPNGVLLVSDKSTDSDFDLVTVSRLISLKNIDKMIRASAKTNVSVAVVGSGPEEHKLKKLAKWKEII